MKKSHGGFKVKGASHEKEHGKKRHGGGKKRRSTKRRSHK